MPIVRFVLRISLVGCLTLGWPSASSAGEWRLGIGYDSANGDRIVASQLDTSKLDTPHLPTPLPPECFRAPGITHVSGLKNLNTFSDVTRSVQVSNIYSDAIVIGCDEKDTVVRLFFEFKDSHSSPWEIISTPNNAAFRAVLLTYISVIGKDTFSSIPDSASDNVILVKMKPNLDDVIFRFGVADKRFVASYLFDDANDLPIFSSIAEKSGFSVITSGPSTRTPGKYNSVISLGSFDNWSFFNKYQEMFVDAAKLYSLSLDVSIARQEATFRSDLGPNWREKMAQEILVRKK